MNARSSRSLTLTTGGITLMGALLSVGVSVGMGLEGEWWARGLAGVATTVGLILLVKLGTSSGRGPLARMAHWVIGSTDTSSSRIESGNEGQADPNRRPHVDEPS